MEAANRLGWRQQPELDEVALLGPWHTEHRQELDDGSSTTEARRRKLDDGSLLASRVCKGNDFMAHRRMSVRTGSRGLYVLETLSTSLGRRRWPHPDPIRRSEQGTRCCDAPR